MQGVVTNSDKGINMIFNDAEEAKIFLERIKEHCYRNIEGFEYRWSYKDKYVNKPFGMTITIDSQEGIETRLFTTPYECWDDQDQRIPSVFEEIQFFVEVFNFISNHRGYAYGRKPTARI
ncbi:hypothetical protein [Parageobacillus thermoglucosidasius]|uniref:Uncharacterized protein n=1 Tax=Parageobacillus thermoglucosidasius TaxID=1426 RepID=A0AB38R466_PARTM|nr:hypothetical protein [Parageobacillus thermoglucosidasius]UOE78393.1 hypothetical protein IMI45_20365 [Parageobacillus thermoglucosidasius]